MGVGIYKLAVKEGNFESMGTEIDKRNMYFTCADGAEGRNRGCPGLGRSLLGFFGKRFDPEMVGSVSFL